MSKLKLATAIAFVLASMQSHAADVYTADATVTSEDNTAVACKAINISNTKQKVFAELINDDSKVLSTTENLSTPKLKDTIVLEPGASHIVLANAGSGTLTARCHFDLDKNKVRAGLGIYKNRGNGSLELYMEAR